MGAFLSLRQYQDDTHPSHSDFYWKTFPRRSLLFGRNSSRAKLLFCFAVRAGDLRTKPFDYLAQLSNLVSVLMCQSWWISALRLCWRRSVDSMENPSSVAFIARHRLHQRLIDLTHQMVELENKKSNIYIHFLLSGVRNRSRSEEFDDVIGNSQRPLS